MVGWIPDSKPFCQSPVQTACTLGNNISARYTCRIGISKYTSASCHALRRRFKSDWIYNTMVLFQKKGIQSWSTLNDLSNYVCGYKNICKYIQGRRLTDFRNTSSISDKHCHDYNCNYRNKIL